MLFRSENGTSFFICYLKASLVGLSTVDKTEGRNFQWKQILTLSITDVISTTDAHCLSFSSETRCHVVHTQTAQEAESTVNQLGPIHLSHTRSASLFKSHPEYPR